MLNNVFDEIYVINMARRPERWELFNKRLPEDWPFTKPVRHEATDGGVVPAPGWWKGGNGAWGCYRSHMRILEDCLNRNVNSFLILEDDAVCVDGFRDKVETFWRHLPDDWEMVYLGGQHIQENLGLPRKVNEWVYKPFNVNRCHCYGFRGRRMLEKVYNHLHDFASWNVPHHIDHYLGELQKTTDGGIYVPREWLVAQDEGDSDICGKKLDYRLFPSSEVTLYPVMDKPGIAILGTYFGGVNTLCGALNELGLPFGVPTGETGNRQQQYYEEHGLGEICRNAYTEPWLTENFSYTDRIAQLRRWAGLQCGGAANSSSCFVGKHPILSLMGPELMEAWCRPKFLCIDRNDEQCYESMKRMAWCWHPVAARRSFRLLREEREAFFKQHSPELLRISFEEMRQNPSQTVERIDEFLRENFTPCRKENAVNFIRKHDDDICVV